MYTRAYARMREKNCLSCVAHCHYLQGIYTVFVRQAPSACAWCVSMSKIAFAMTKLGTKKMRSNLLERIR